MNSLLKIFLVFIFYLLPFSSLAYERIVSLKPNLTEILFSLGVGEKIVGVTTFCDYPPEAKKIDKVSDYMQPDLEKLISKKPDLIISSEENSQRREIEFLRYKGYRVLTFNTDSLDHFRETLLSLGQEVGRLEQAKSLLKNFDAEMESLKQKAQSSSPNGQMPKALFVVGQHPLVVAGSGNLLNDILPYIGLKNAVVGSKLKYPTFSLEQLYSVAPEYIIDFSMGTESSEKAREEARLGFEKMKNLPAVQKKKIYFWDIGKLRASPRLPIELKKLFEAIHPLTSQNGLQTFELPQAGVV